MNREGGGEGEKYMMMKKKEVKGKKKKKVNALSHADKKMMRKQGGVGLELEFGFFFLIICLHDS